MHANYNLSFYTPPESPKTSEPQTLLFIHGAQGSKKGWEGVINQLKDNYRVYAIDLRGWGESPLGNEDYTLELLADDVDKFVKDHHLGPLVIVGHSMGARVGVAYAALHPENVRGLVMEDQDLEKGKVYIPDPNQLSQAKDLHPLHNSRERAEAELSKLTAFSTEEIKNWKKDEIKQIDENKWFISVRPYTWYLASKACYGNEKAKTLFGNLKNIPVMLMKAEKGAGATETGIAELQRLKPDMEIRRVDGATHNIHKSKTGQFTQNLTEFLEKINCKTNIIASL